MGDRVRGKGREGREGGEGVKRSEGGEEKRMSVR